MQSLHLSEPHSSQTHSNVSLRIGETTMASIPGSWTVRYSWGCGSSYPSFTAVFAANGTWAGSGFSGKWAFVEGMLMFNFNSGPAIYAGVITGNAGAGIASTLAGLNGCWFATKAGVAAASKVGGGTDAAGNKGAAKAGKKSSKKK
jgi:hypothetical protein